MNTSEPLGLASSPPSEYTLLHWSASIRGLADAEIQMLMRFSCLMVQHAYPYTNSSICWSKPVSFTLVGGRFRDIRGHQSFSRHGGSWIWVVVVVHHARTNECDSCKWQKEKHKNLLCAFAND